MSGPSRAAAPFMRDCVRCGQHRLHKPRSDNPTKPQPYCPPCTSAYLREYRERRWQRTKARNTLHGAIERCHNPERRRWANHPSVPRWRDYGGRGITVCKRWRDPKKGLDNFIADVGLPPSKDATLDRRNPNRNYSCGQCSDCIDEALERRSSTMNHRFVDMTGQRVGMLTVKAFAGIDEKCKTATWLCLCDCGGETTKRRTYLRAADRSGMKVSCGCNSRRGKKPRKPKLSAREVAINAIVKTYKRSARVRGLDWDLAREEVVGLIFSPCYYCGTAWSNTHEVKRTTSPTRLINYNGIDRKNNAVGYLGDNCVPCCETCNHAKHKMTHDEFLSWVMRVASNEGLFASNCRWVDPRTQQLNKRTTHWVRAEDPNTHEVLTLCISDWARRMGIKRRTIHGRIRRGWPEDEACTIPTWGSVQDHGDQELDDDVPF